MAWLRITSLALVATALTATPALAASDKVAPYGYELFEIPLLGVPITNVMATTWAIAILLILALRALTKQPTLVPKRGQALVEGLLTGIYDTMEPIVGRHMIKPVFPLLITLFVFILINNWSGLFPGVGSFGWWAPDYPAEAISAAEAQELINEGTNVVRQNGEYYPAHFEYFFRPANSDLNTTLALGIVSFVAWLYFVLRYAGAGTLLYDIFGNKADRKEVGPTLYFSLFIVFLAVGLIEVLSILSRLISLPFRLYGNVYGGESLLTSMHGLVAWLLPVPFFFLELVIGLVQALVFTLLTAVYIGLICNHDSEDHGHGGQAAHAH